MLRVRLNMLMLRVRPVFDTFAARKSSAGGMKLEVTAKSDEDRVWTEGRVWTGLDKMQKWNKFGRGGRLSGHFQFRVAERRARGIRE